MLTLFCSPKPFRDEAAWNQINALRSWRTIGRDVEILIFGDAPGAAEAAAEVEATFLPEVECSPSGAPSFNAMGAYARKHGRYDLQVYVNADIVLNASAVWSMAFVGRRFERFLLVGERLDLAENTTCDVRQANWPNQLGSWVDQGRAKLQGPTAVDYFGFRRGTWEDLAPVYMGRAGCDQALLHYCLKRAIPVIDGTLAMLAVHQFHDYRHVKGGKQQVSQGDDRKAMSRAHGLWHSVPTIADADYRITESGQIDRNCRRRWLRRMELGMRYRLGMDRAAMVLRALQYLGGRSYVASPTLHEEAVLRCWMCAEPPVATVCSATTPGTANRTRPEASEE
jgi:hypothetical protein